MDKEILQFYKEKHYHPMRVIDKGRKRGFNKLKIEKAMELVYEDIEKGTEIPDIDIGRCIFDKAKHLDEIYYEEGVDISDIVIAKHKKAILWLVIFIAVENWFIAIMEML